MTVEQHQRSGRIEILTVGQGFTIGVVGAVAMAVVAMTGSAITGQGLWTPINAIGSFFTGTQPIPAGFAGGVTLLGVLVQLVMGGLLGMLYASAQERLDSPSLLIIAVYYGFITWFVASFFVLRWLNPTVAGIWRSWTVLLGQLAYGAVLGVFAVWRSRQLPQARKR